jgi:hypothetical protein
VEGKAALNRLIGPSRRVEPRNGKISGFLTLDGLSQRGVMRDHDALWGIERASARSSFIA